MGSSSEKADDKENKVKAVQSGVSSSSARLAGHDGTYPQISPRSQFFFANVRANGGSVTFFWNAARNMTQEERSAGAKKASLAAARKRSEKRLAAEGQTKPGERTRTEKASFSDDAAPFDPG